MITPINFFKTNFVVEHSSKNKTIFANVINFSFLISLSLVLTIGRIYPLNYIANAGFIVLCVLMLLFVYIYDHFYIDRYVVIITLLNIFSLFSGIVNKFEGETFTLSFLSIGMMPVYFYFKHSVESRRVAINIIPIAYCIFNLFFFFLYFKEFINLDFSTRLGSKIGNQNDVATYLLTAHTVFLYLLLKKHFYLIPFILLNFVEMIGTGSRSGLLNILIISLLILYLIIGRKNKLLFLIVVIFGVTIFYCILFLPQLTILKKRFDDLFLEVFTNQNTDESTSSRFDLFFESFEYFLRNPFFGGGQDFAFNYTFNGDVAHNTYIELGASRGLFVVILFLMLFIYPLQLKDKSNAVLRIVLISNFLLFYFTLSGYYYKPPYYIVPVLASFNSDKTYFDFVLHRNFMKR